MFLVFLTFLTVHEYVVRKTITNFPKYGRKTVSISVINNAGALVKPNGITKNLQLPKQV